jgi:hypothetical protein
MGVSGVASSRKAASPVGWDFPAGWRFALGFRAPIVEPISGTSDAIGSTCDRIDGSFAEI